MYRKILKHLPKAGGLVLARLPRMVSKECIFDKKTEKYWQELSKDNFIEFRSEEI